MPVKTASYEKGKLYELDLGTVQPDPEQPRKYFDEQALAELQASIVTHGVLQPILVRQDLNDGFLVVSGERRYQAAKNAGLATIPAILTDGEPAEISIIENLLRENLTAIEEAEAIERLQSIHEYGVSELATALGKAVSTLSEILALNRLPDEVKNDCRNEPKTPRWVLVEIAKQATPQRMIALYAKYKETGLTRGEIRKKTPAPKPANAPIDLGFLAAFSERLDTLDLAKLDAEQKATVILELNKMRGVAYQKIKLLKL
jgi:ParB family transcriptional regulator, chromosome partitioning protein